MMMTRLIKVPTEPIVMRILVRCPATARLFVTGLTTKANSFAQIEVVDNRLTCAHCGKVHLWTEENIVFGRQSGGRKDEVRAGK